MAVQPVAIRSQANSKVDVRLNRESLKYQAEARTFVFLFSVFLCNTIFYL
jgi:hypothetical protein